MNKPVLSVLGEAWLELGDGAETSFGPWRLRRGADGIAWALLDCPQMSANTLSEDVLTELDSVLDALEKDIPNALVIRSAKAGGFVAGADIGAFRNARSEADVRERLTRGHRIIDRLEALSCPTIAVVHGYALGGGFELALACDWRVAIEGAHFGFPEVRLGLHPGLGGTFRLPDLIDPMEAMTMMLTGKPAYASKAARLGISDVTTQERHVKAAVADLAAKGKPDETRSLKEAALDFGAARRVVGQRMRARAEEKAPRDHYPAPHALIDIWERHGGDRDAMQEAEIDSFCGLLMTETAQNLTRVFFLREGLKKTGAENSGIRHVHVVGAGTMGAEIAAWCAIKGLKVTLSDIRLEPLATAVRRARETATDAHLDDRETRDALDRLIPDPKDYGLAHADLVIEAAPEKPGLKRDLLASIEERARKDAIIATNTSSLELGELAQTLNMPERFAGLHFFNPVSKMELVEVVSHDKAAKPVLTALSAFVVSIGRLPAPVASYPGFLVNRILTPYLLEAALLVDEGMDKADVDGIAEDFGMAMGPLEVADRVGLDICIDVAESLGRNLDMPMAEIPGWMRRKVENGKLGAKTGEGIFTWKDGKPDKGSANADAETGDAGDRMILPMLNAAVECLRKKVTDNADTVDAALILAAGFAPFRGGPLHYARQRGIEDVRDRLLTLTEAHGPRFTPDKGWNDLA